VTRLPGTGRRGRVLGLVALLLTLLGPRSLGAAETKEAAQPNMVDKAGLGLSITTSGQAIFIPEALLSNVYSDYKWQANAGGFLSLGLTGLPIVEPQIHLGFNGLGLPAGTFRELGAPAYESFFLDVDLQVFTLMARARFDWNPWRNLHLGTTAGAGMWVFLGSVKGNESLPGCSEPVSDCGHWDRVGSHDLIIVTGGQEIRLSEISGAVVPAVSLDVHIGYEFVKGWLAGAEGGVVNLLPFAGAWLRYEFGF
jgi:hypothetical protein